VRGHKTTQKNKIFFLLATASGLGSVGKKRKKWLCVLVLFRIMCRWLGVRFNDAKPKLCEVAKTVFMA
jgi:hypothetical protein